MAKRFFSEGGFWNTPIGPSPQIDPRSDHFIEMLSGEPNGPFGINLSRWTVPVYEVGADVPRRKVARRVHAEADLRARSSAWVGVGDRFGHFPEFDELGVPLPSDVKPDAAGDCHLAVVQWSGMLAWDMWGVEVRPDGSLASNTGMAYRLDGDGVFRTGQFGVKDGESIHFHGPSRAAGVPAIAGLIMHDEVTEGLISHKPVDHDVCGFACHVLAVLNAADIIIFFRAPIGARDDDRLLRDRAQVFERVDQVRIYAAFVAVWTPQLGTVEVCG